MLSVFSSARTTGSPRGHGRIVDCHSRRDFAQNRVQRPDIRVIIIVVVVVVRLAFGPRLRCATHAPRISRIAAPRLSIVLCVLPLPPRHDIYIAAPGDHFGEGEAGIIWVGKRVSLLFILCAAIRSRISSFLLRPRPFFWACFILIRRRSIKLFSWWFSLFNQYSISG